jgi:hypothetical protein
MKKLLKHTPIMKKILIILTLFVSDSVSTIANSIDSLYYSALNEITLMLEDKQEISFKRAVFLV